MGPGVSDVTGSEGGGSGAAEEAAACSICLEALKYGGNRSTAKLQCGHDFHLDCIGSAFNVKGMMQCPNCRKIEKGNWLYGNGCCFFPVFNTDGWRHDEELYDFNYLEMPYGVRWCPFSRTARVTSTFGPTNNFFSRDGESLPSVAFQDTAGRHVAFTEIPSVSFAAHLCPHLAYIHPLQMPSPPSPYSSNAAADTNLYYHQWSPAVASTEDSSSQRLPLNEPDYYGWEHHPSLYAQPRNVNVASNQASVSHVVPRNIRLDTGGPSRTGFLIHSFVGTHGFPSLPVLPYSSRTQTNPNLYEILQQRHISNEHQTSFMGTWRSRGTRDLHIPVTVHSSFYISPSPNLFPSGREDIMSTGEQFQVFRRVHQFMPFTVHPFASAAAGFQRRHASQGQLPPARDESPPYRLPVGPFSDSQI